MYFFKILEFMNSKYVCFDEATCTKNFICSNKFCPNQKNDSNFYCTTCYHIKLQFMQAKNKIKHLIAIPHQYVMADYVSIDDINNVFFFTNMNTIDKDFKETENFEYLSLDPIRSKIFTINREYFSIGLSTCNDTILLNFTIEDKTWFKATFSLYPLSKKSQKYIGGSLYEFKRFVNIINENTIRKVLSISFHDYNLDVNPLKRRTAEVNENNRKKLKKEKIDKLTNSLIICYDIETTTIDSNLVPYMIGVYCPSYNFEKVYTNKKTMCTPLSYYGCEACWKYPKNRQLIYKKKDGTFSTVCREDLMELKSKDNPYPVNEFNMEVADMSFNDCTCYGEAGIIYQAFLEIAKLSITAFTEDKEVIIIGYNNFNFDDLICSVLFDTAFREELSNSSFLKESFNEQIEWSIRKRTEEREGKVVRKSWDIIATDVPFRVTKPKTKYTVHFKDCVQYVPDCSLSQACDDYDIINSKEALNAKIVSDYLADSNEIKEYIDLKTVKELGLKIEKVYFEPRKKSYNLIKAVEHYCLMDCKATYELFTKIIETLQNIFNETGVDNHPLDYVSIAQLSKSIFESITNYNSPTHGIEIPTEESMIAGRVDHGILGLYKSEGNLSYWDVTSEYPMAMTAPYPVGDPIITSGSLETEKLQNIINIIYEKRESQFINGLTVNDDISYMEKLPFGFYSVSIATPPEEERLCTWGPLGCHVSYKNIYIPAFGKNHRVAFNNVKIYDRYLNSINIKTLLFAGYKVKLNPYKNHYIYNNSDKIFLPFIEKVGKLKTEEKEAGARSKAKLLKLILNSLAGKLGQKRNAVYSYFHYDETIVSKADTEECEPIKGLDDKYQKYFTAFKLKNPDDWKETTVGHMANTSSNDNINYNKSSHDPNHYLASYVWGYANFALWSTVFKLHINAINKKQSLFEKRGIILYCDTDSILFDKSRSTHMEFDSSEEIGKWNDKRQEFDMTWKCKFQNADQFFCFGKKSYAVIQNGDIVQKTFKGIREAGLKEMTLEVLQEISKNYVTNYVNEENLNTSFVAKSNSLSKTKLLKSNNSAIIVETEQIRTINFPDKSLITVSGIDIDNQPNCIFTCSGWKNLKETCEELNQTN